MGKMETKLYSVKEAAPLINCSTITMRRFIKSGVIGYKKIGKRFFFTDQHIQNYLDKAEVLPCKTSENYALKRQ
jgi:excisionase family DNA binding protein